MNATTDKQAAAARALAALHHAGAIELDRDHAATLVRFLRCHDDAQPVDDLTMTRADSLAARFASVLRTFAVWRARTVASVQLRLPEDADTIAARLVAAERHGTQDPPTVRHEAAAFYRTRCQCRRCEAARS